MRLTCVWALLLPLLLASQSAAHAADFERNGHTFHLPDGFTIELVAGPPLVNRPISADFDEQGRLYVTDSSGSNDPLEKQLKEKPHRVMRLEDVDGDGCFDRSTVFADRMMFPEGCLWFNGSLYVAAVPSIWKLTDTNDDGQADRREEWFQGKTVTHCGNDLHGPYLGPDGWIYWCKGAYAKQIYERVGKPPFVTRAAHIFRCRPDAPRDPATGSVLTSAIEPVMTGGMANPVDVTFTPGGERVFTTTFVVHPAGGLRDGLVHAVYGGVYGQQRDALNGHKRTGDLMPVMQHLGAAAPCGLTRYESSVFGDAYRDDLFACLFNMRKVTHHRLVPDGATFKTEIQDFLVSDNVDFHPTDVLEDADGSLLVVDTGGWYKLCCPTSQLWKPDILGAIYRIRRTDAVSVPDPRGVSFDWPALSVKALSQLLDDRRPAVQHRAIAELARRGRQSISVLAQSLHPARSDETRLNAVWALTRVDAVDARAAVRGALHDDNETVRQAAIHSVSIWRDREATGSLINVLRSSSVQNRRVAAEALGRIGDASAVPELLAASGEGPGRVLEHSLTYALIEIADANSVRAFLDATNAHTRRAALIALDQMDGRTLQPNTIVPLLSAKNAGIKDTAAWIVDHHSDWGSALCSYFAERIRDTELPPNKRNVLTNRMARFASDASVQQLMAQSLADRQLPISSKRVVLQSMAKSGLKELPKVWAKSVASLLASNQPQLEQDAVTALRSLLAAKQTDDALATALLAIGLDSTKPPELRLDALATVPGGIHSMDPKLFAFVTQHLDQQFPVSVRATATEVLVRARLKAAQLITLADRLKTVSPLDIEPLLKAFRRSSADSVGLALVAGLKQSSARSALRVETLKPQLVRFSQPVQAHAAELYAMMNEEIAGQRARLEELLTTLPAGDMRHGQAVFRSSKASCSACHSIGYLGGNVGPDLTRIARIRTERDLLEAIAFPSASLVRSFEPVAVVTVSGKVYNGLIRSDTSDTLVLATGPNKEARIPRDEVDQMLPSKISIMPTGLDKQLTPQELADLLAFLETTK